MRSILAIERMAERVEVVIVLMPVLEEPERIDAAGELIQIIGQIGNAFEASERLSAAAPLLPHEDVGPWFFQPRTSSRIPVWRDKPLFVVRHMVLQETQSSLVMFPVVCEFPGTA